MISNIITHICTIGVLVMRKTVITVPHLFTSISAFSAESKSYIIALRFNVLETLQINQTYFQISNSTSIESL